MNRMQIFTVLGAALVIGGCASTDNQSTANDTQATGTSPTQASSRPAGAPAPHSASQIGMGQGGSSRAATRGSSPNARSVYFEYDKSELSAEDRRLIEANARYLRQHPDSKVRVEGNADERGSAEYNLALGQRRAENVARALRAGGVTEDRLEAVSYGKEKPKAEGHDEKSWAENRRSDMVYR
jgi:peptidoglycan-associated lipoprotein